MGNIKNLIHELERQYSIIFGITTDLDRKTEQAFAFIVIVLGYLSQSGSLKFIKNPSGWPQFVYIFGLLIFIISFLLCVVAYRIQKVHIGSKHDYLIKMYREKLNFLDPAIIIGLSRAIEKVKEINARKAMMLRWVHTLVFISVVIIIVCELILRSKNV